jgi:HD-GYP domain-containing protein (c-di-GMP phosphodiesterase class II)
MTDIFQKQLTTGEVLISETMAGPEGYGPLPLRNLAVGWDIPFDLYLKVKEKGDAVPRLVKCCDRGEIFREDWHQKLADLNIPCVYIALTEVERVLQYLHHNLETALGDDSKTELEKGLLVCDATHMWTLNFFNSEEARTGKQINLAIKFLDTLFEMIRTDRQNLLYLMEIRRHSFRLYTHCLNVCLLGLAFTDYLGWSPDKVQGFGLGALLHDIGLIRMPRIVLEKRDKLTPEEMVKVKRHPQDGFQMVQVFIQLRWEALQMVLQHHENGDGSGYPDGLKMTGIHPWARILRVLDSYEAMTAERPWRSAMLPTEALWNMRHEWEKSKLFDQNYLKTFIKFLAGN